MLDDRGSEAAARFFYRFRFLTSAVVIALVAGLFAGGAKTLTSFGDGLKSLGDVTNGSGTQPGAFFDSRMDIWFDEADPAVGTFYEIEDRFVAEDYVMVSFEVKDHPLGVFSPESLATIQRLSREFLTIPGVRHVRSLTDNPWIRWGTIQDEHGTESGLIISDLFEKDAPQYSEREIIERMVATLGADRTAARLGEEKVRQVIGTEAKLEDHLGEPRLLGTIINDTGTVATIQLQVLRPKYVARGKALPELMTEKLASSLFSSRFQQAALRGLEHFVRLEQGYAVPTEEFGPLKSWIESLPDGERKSSLLFELKNPTRNFMRNKEGNLVRKYYEYDLMGDGSFVDRSDPAAPIVAPADFKPEPKSPHDFKLGGIPHFERNFEEVGLSDAKYVPFMFLVMALVLVLVFRKVVGLAAPLAVVFGSILGMVGFSLMRGNLFNNLTMISPNMLTAVGIADAIHLIASWVALRPHFDNKRDLVQEVMRKNALPVLLTSVTTAIGFWSLTVSTILPVRMLGTITGLGTVFAYLLSMTIVPAILSLVPHNPKKIKANRGLAVYFNEHRSRRFVDFILRNRRRVLVCSAIVVGVALVGVARIQIDSDFRGMFPDDNKVMQDFVWIEDHLGGVGDLELVFEAPIETRDAAPLTPGEQGELESLRLADALALAKEGSKLTDSEKEKLRRLEEKFALWDAKRIGVQPDFLVALDKFERRLRREMKEGNTPLYVLTDLMSPLDVLRKMHQVQNENKAAYYRVPLESDVAESAKQSQLNYDEWTEEWSLTPPQDGQNLVAQYYLQYENGAKPGEKLSTQLSAKRTHFRMQGRVAQAKSLTLLAAFDRIREIARTEFPELTASVQVKGKEAPRLADLTLSGKMLLNARTMDVFSKGFLMSMSLALLAISILIAVIFRSFRLALISIVPNVLPIAIPLSFFGIFNVPLHGPAILVSSIALGVCVDDTIHFFTQFSRGRARGMSNRDALVKMVKESGTAVFVTSLILMAGFSSLILSDFTPNKIMGYLAVGMIGLALVADLFVAPALLSLLPEEKQQKISDDSQNTTVSVLQPS